MDEVVVSRCVDTKSIDSFQKLRVLLFFYQHPDIQATCQQLVEDLYLGDTLLLENILSDLHTAGLLDCTNNHCSLRKTPEITHCLQCLREVFENPIARQRLLDQVRSHLPGDYPFNH